MHTPIEKCAGTNPNRTGGVVKHAKGENDVFGKRPPEKPTANPQHFRSLPRFGTRPFSLRLFHQTSRTTKKNDPKWMILAARTYGNVPMAHVSSHHLDEIVCSENVVPWTFV